MMYAVIGLTAYAVVITRIAFALYRENKSTMTFLDRQYKREERGRRK